MSVTTSGGDRESLGLARMVSSEDHSFYHLLFVGVRPNADFNAVRRSIERLGARINSISPSRRYANVFVFDPANVPRVAGALARRRDIDVVDVDGYATCGLAGCAPGPAFFAMLRGGLPFRARSNQPTPFDGHLEIQPGDTIRLAVTQPDGTTLSREHVVPAWSPGGPSRVYSESGTH